MSLQLNCPITMITNNIQVQFQESGGIGPYIYSIVSGGPIGSIDSNGLYTAPPYMSGIDTVMVKDATLATATCPISIRKPIGLVCDIIQTKMNLSSGRVYIYNNKINEPTDNGIFISVGVLNSKIVGNTSYIDSTMVENQSVTIFDTLEINLISRDQSAMWRQGDLIMALGSNYSQQQQEINNFKIGRIPTSFVNISGIDGAAIPYRYNLNISMQYMTMNINNVGYYDTFTTPTVTIN